DSAAHALTAHFCSAGSSPAAIAYYVVDLGSGSSGKLKAVALNRDDSTSVIESNEVTFNGGIDGAYPPVILLAGRSHISSELRVRAVGLGLADAPVVQIAAPDTSWHLALEIIDRTDTSLLAKARVAADLPPFVLQIGGDDPGAMAVAPLAADTASVLAVPPACVDFMKEINLITHEQIQPKDFAIVTSRDSFHVFYIRHDMNLSTDATEKIIGHKRSRNLNDWFPTENTMTAIQVRPSRWDNFHVWAPTIVKKPEDPNYYMLYTGVTDTLINLAHRYLQRIGVATSIDLNVWTQDTTWAYDPSNTTWAETDLTSYSGQQFRDPFVMADPDSAGHYILLFVAGSKYRKPRMVVGVAKTYGPVVDFRKWYDVGPLWRTDSLHTGAAVVESPHAFVDPGGRWSLYYTGYNSLNDSALVSFETNDVSPIDADTTRWSAPPDTLYKVLGGDPFVQWWHGSEYLHWAPGYEYMAAYDDEQHAVDIAQVSWRGAHTFVLYDSCPPAAAPLAVDPKEGHPTLALSLLGAMPAHVPVRFMVQASARSHVRLAIYDVLGRRVRTLLDEEILPGRWELRWDGRGATGDAVGSGIYFARLTSGAGQRLSRVILLR
ncbi:MAG TPA: hypothetical protein VLU24_03290, partial [Mycobacterium sp.]|nr:hypothetical protein [Mycobacterium sp.]